MPEHHVSGKLCLDTLQDLSLYLDHEATAQLCEEIERHLAECADCRVVFDTLQRTISLYRAHPEPEMPGSLRERLYRTFQLEAYSSRMMEKGENTAMSITATDLGTTVHLELDFETALARAVEALKSQGFGVLTEIDVKETMKKKLNVDFRPYRILGACNPPLAHRALTAAPEVGLLLPCNITVVFVDEHHTDVSLVNPMSMLRFVDRPDLTSIAQEADGKLRRVAELLKQH